MNILRGLFILAPLVLMSAAPSATADLRQAAQRPNILFFIADDLGARWCGAYGDPVAKTPAIDRLAREGVRFDRAFCASPSCTPSRSAILTGQAIYRLEEGGLLMGALPAKFPVFPLLLEKAGYFIGHTGKTWSPGNLRAGGWGDRHPCGQGFEKRRNNRNKLYDPALPDYWANDYAANFKDFLDARKSAASDRPFFFWCGTIQPHLPWVRGSGVKSGKSPAEAAVPAWLPDHPVVRSDVLDYATEIEYADSHLGRILKMLEEAGELDNTLIILTGDHGTPLPRAKCNLYDAGTQVPLIVRYPPVINAGRTVSDIVSLADIAPTLLEAGGTMVPREVTGRTLAPLLRASESGRIDSSRDSTIIAFERHTWCRPNGVGYPMRAIRTDTHLYIRNYEPDRWPNGDPDFDSAAQGVIGDSDHCPTKALLLQNKSDAAMGKYYELAWGKRPAEELYDVTNDPDQLHNLAGDSQHAKTKEALRAKLEAQLAASGDPRSRGQAPWDSYPYYAEKVKKNSR